MTQLPGGACQRTYISFHGDSFAAAVHFVISAGCGNGRSRFIVYAMHSMAICIYSRSPERRFRSVSCGAYSGSEFIIHNLWYGRLLLVGRQIGMTIGWIVCNDPSLQYNNLMLPYFYKYPKISGKILINFFFLQNFREQSIDGSGLPMLTEDHLMNSLGMKLGPALKLRSVLAKKLGGPCSCIACSLSMNATSPGGSLPRPSSVDSEQ